MSSDVNYISYFGPDVTAAYSGRSFPNKLHKTFLKEIDISHKDAVTVNQVHGDKIVILKSKAEKNLSSPDVFIGDPLDSRFRGNDNAKPEADAIITNLEGVALAIKTADCIPLFLFDPTSKTVGLVHAGWKGLEKRIVSKTIQAMKSEFGVKPQNLKVVFGVAIHDCCYEVGKDFAQKFNKDYYTKRNGALYLDLIHVAGEQLIKENVNLQNVQDLEVCPSCRNEEFFSYRKEKTDERILSVIQIQP